MKSSRILAASAAFVAIAVGGTLGWQAFATHPQAPAVGYTLLDGSRHSTADLRGKVTLVNFWSTDCTTCMHEMPQMVATYDRYKARGLDTLAVSMSYDPPAYVMNYAESRKLPFGVAIDNTGQIAKSFGEVRLTPTTVVIDKRGEIVKRYVGEPDFAQLDGLIEQLLAQPA